MKHMKFLPELVPMVKDGTKTVTRRPVKPQPKHVSVPEEGFVHCDDGGYVVGRDRYLNQYGEEDVDYIPFPDPNNAMPFPCGIVGTVFQSDAGPLRIKSVMVERLQDWDAGDAFLQLSNALLWDQCYIGTEYNWNANPWVWVIEFEVAP